jgi:hypothetical protein
VVLGHQGRDLTVNPSRDGPQILAYIGRGLPERLVQSADSPAQPPLHNPSNPQHLAPQLKILPQLS